MLFQFSSHNVLLFSGIVETLWKIEPLLAAEDLEQIKKKYIKGLTQGKTCVVSSQLEGS